MTLQYAKTIRKKLRELAGLAHERELTTHQSSQKLKILREHALVESAISSNRIEGINIDQSRINTLILGKPLLKDRSAGAVWQKRGNTLKKG